MFPTQDGPIHLYYAHIIGQLQSGSERFSEYFSIRYPPPPYIIHYLLLLGLSHVFGALAAEKLMVCLIVVLTSGGFLALLKSVSGRGILLALLGIPLSLNWTVGMGFHNFGLSLAMSLFAMACWIRARSAEGGKARLGFLGLAALMLFTHPVPLVFTLLFVWTDLVVGVLLQDGPVKGLLSFASGPNRRDLMTALGGSLTLSYIFLFVDRGRASEDVHRQFIQWGMLRDLLHGRPFSLVFQTRAAFFYQCFLFALAGLGLLFAVVALRTGWKNRVWSGSKTMALLAVLLVVLYPVIPRGMNGSDYFGDRLVLYIWMFLIVAIAERPVAASIRWHYAVAGICSVVAISVLAIDDGDIRAAAMALHEMEHEQPAAPGPTGIFVATPRPPTKGHLTYDPYLWAAARYFRRTNSIMMNAPWLGLPILPIASTNRLLAAQFPERVINYPDRFVGDLIRDQNTRNLVEKQIDFIVFIGFSGAGPNVRDRVVEEKWTRPWVCQRQGWLAVCSDK